MVLRMSPLTLQGTHNTNDVQAILGHEKRKRKKSWSFSKTGITVILQYGKEN